MFSLSENNIHIENSYEIPRRRFKKNILDALSLCPEYKGRSVFSMQMEWATHNFLYKLHIMRSRTASVDLDTPMSWWMSALYVITGCISWLFIE